MTEMPRKPLPEPSGESRPYWEGLAAGRLMLQRCAACGRIRHYPRPLCDACHSFETGWVAASGEASVQSWTVAHHPYHPAFRGELPYTLVTADLPEGVRLVAQLRDAGPEALRLGAPLRIGIEENGEGQALPVLRLAGG
ncbi:Zn-ribbon domain-containing OB-fold protein [Roseicella frigidaeris]|nr:OB-fold domain-containing protein [Roseicella frigidaeris]